MNSRHKTDDQAVKFYTFKLQDVGTTCDLEVILYNEFVFRANSYNRLTETHLDSKDESLVSGIRTQAAFRNG